MKLKIDKSFEKDTMNINNTKLLMKVATCIENVLSAETTNDINNIKKLTGFKYHYRIRIGDYRVGLVIKNNEVIFERLIHRKDLYKYFP